MKRLIVMLVTGGVLTVPAAFSQNGKVIEKRETRQQKRIAQGVNNGSLTPHETTKLERKEAAIAREERRDRADGGGLSPKEKAKITRQQDRVSKQIYREKHDNQTQK